ncbi:cellulase family glycosylhydrolase [Streptomyces sp. ISL-99]|nr:cellulase family glycosylhydrolase [Streptomyces sp. ISL-99]MBT2525801.1 cellulase family glycosylhydrolase [Streptomyces sp. ISL-99]
MRKPLLFASALGILVALQSPVSATESASPVSANGQLKVCGRQLCNEQGQAVQLRGTRAWSSFGVSEGADEQEVVRNPVNSSNIMYTFHFYAASHRGEYLDALNRASDRLPVFVTEFGTQNYAGEGANDFAQSQRFLDLMKRKKISWTDWNYSDDNRSGAVFKTGTCNGDTWAGTGVLKEAGIWIRQRIRE